MGRIADRFARVEPRRRTGRSGMPARCATVERELYVPRSRTEDAARCQTAGLDDQLTFRTKPEPATAMIERFLDTGRRADRVAGDEVYGGNPKLRAAREARGCSYVPTVACSAEVVTAAGKFRADAPAGSPWPCSPTPSSPSCAPRNTTSTQTRTT